MNACSRGGGRPDRPLEISISQLTDEIDGYDEKDKRHAYAAMRSARMAGEARGVRREYLRSQLECLRQEFASLGHVVGHTLLSGGQASARNSSPAAWPPVAAARPPRGVGARPPRGTGA